MKKNKYPFIIAEIGCNHNGEIDLAKEMIKSAKEVGVDAIKLQLFSKESLITQTHLEELDKGIVKLENIDKWESKELGLNSINDQIDKFIIGYDAHIKLFEYARKIGVHYSSTPVTKEGVDFLVDQKVDFIKVASMDVNNPDFIEYVLSKKLPTVISLGLASLGEIENIVNLVGPEMKSKVTLLHTISLYPPSDKIINLNFIVTLRNLFDLPIGYSDHSLGYSIPLAAIALGASMIEKHFTLDKNMPGWDHKVSANPKELKIICEESKRIYNSLGNGKKVLTTEEIEKRKKFRRSLVASRDINKGEKFVPADFDYKRPGTGIPPDEVKRVVGRIAHKNIKKDQTIFWEDIM